MGSHNAVLKTQEWGNWNTKYKVKKYKYKYKTSNAKNNIKIEHNTQY